MSIKKKSYRLACHNKYLPIMMFFRSVIEEKLDAKKMSLFIVPIYVDTLINIIVK